MGATYTLHLPRGALPGDAAALDRAELVRDGFSWGAFLAPALYFLVKRRPLLALGAVVAVGGTAWGLSALGLRPGSVLLVELLLHGLIGLEASSLLRWAHGRRGRPAVDAVAAANGDEAEAKAFARWLARPAPERPSFALPAAPRGRPEPVFGLFPDFEGRR